MSRNAHAFRWLIVACLMVGVCSVSSASQLTSIAGDAAPKSAAASLASCCGHADASCCAAACCVPLSPKGPETPAPAPSPTESSPSGIGFIFSEAYDLRLVRKFSAYAQQVLNSRGSLLELSLQSLQVRLEI